MAYVDYEFYQNEYYGDIINEIDFRRLSARASDKLDELTYYRLVDGLPDDEALVKRIKKAVCGLAEKLNDISIAESMLRSNGGNEVKSVSSGSESITYMSGSESTVNLADKKVQQEVLYATVAGYLVETGLLYAGID